MDHTGAYHMAMAILLALIHRQRTGEGQWVDLACTDAALTLHGPALLDWTVNARPTRRPGQPHSNRNQWPAMAPHGIYRCAGEDDWVAIACRNQADWTALASAIDEAWCEDPAYADLEARLSAQDALDQGLTQWTRPQTKFEVEERLQTAGVPVAPVLTPEERIDADTGTGNFGLWPTVAHTEMGDVRVDGQPVHFSTTDWQMTRGGPCLGEHNEDIFTRVLGLTKADVEALAAEGVI